MKDYYTNFMDARFPHLMAILSNYKDDGFGRIIALWRTKSGLEIQFLITHFISQEH